MASQNVCQMYRYGYCKFQATCRKQHILEKCNKTSCEIKTCSKRHPVICRYLRDRGYCKFGEWCLFEHNFGDDKQSIKEITNKLDTIEKLVEEKSKTIDSLEKTIVEREENILEKMENKLKVFEGNIQTMKKCIADKDIYITSLEDTIKNNDMKFEECRKEQMCKMVNLEKANDENVLNIAVLMQKLGETDCKIQQKSKDILKCSKCDFETKSKKGLNTHVTRKHTDTTTMKFPKKCDLCDKDLKSANELRNHLKTHSYKEAKFQCEDCEFVGNTRETMNVHIGRFHTDQFECGLCEINLGNSSSLDVHLNTCEIYRCRMCWEEKKTISELRDHLKNHDNPQHIVIEHYKMSRSSNSEVSITGYKGKDF